MTDEQKAELEQLEHAVRDSDGAGIKARWESGRRLVALRDGAKRLPDGVREFMADQLKVSPSEISKRQQFAERFQTEDELCAAVTQFSSWHRIVNEALVTKKKACVKLSAAARLAKAIANFDPADATIDEREGEALIVAAQNLIEGVSYLIDRKAA
jgi:hypothetical protein